jgi:hypothetical protein
MQETINFKGFEEGSESSRRLSRSVTGARPPAVGRAAAAVAATRRAAAATAAAAIAVVSSSAAAAPS